MASRASTASTAKPKQSALIKTQAQALIKKLDNLKKQSLTKGKYTIYAIILDIIGKFLNIDIYFLPFHELQNIFTFDIKTITKPAIFNNNLKNPSFSKRLTRSFTGVIATVKSFSSKTKTNTNRCDKSIISKIFSALDEPETDLADNLFNEFTEFINNKNCVDVIIRGEYDSLLFICNHFNNNLSNSNMKQIVLESKKASMTKDIFIDLILNLFKFKSEDIKKQIEELVNLYFKEEDKQILTISPQNDEPELTAAEIEKLDELDDANLDSISLKSENFELLNNNEIRPSSAATRRNNATRPSSAATRPSSAKTSAISAPVKKYFNNSKHVLSKINDMNFITAKLKLLRLNKLKLNKKLIKITEQKLKTKISELIQTYDAQIANLERQRQTLLIESSKA